MWSNLVQGEPAALKSLLLNTTKNLQNQIMYSQQDDIYVSH